MMVNDIPNEQQIKEWCNGASEFSTEVLEWVAKENLWNIWVPERYGGLEMPFHKGLKKLQQLARTDGSLGWTVTLCAGANYFIGNLQPEVAQELFEKPVVFGGSGGMFGIAEKEGDSYRLNGTWRYATGAPYLTHFTLNAKVLVNGKEQTNADGSPKFLSFVIPADRVNIINDWNSMGLKASATHSFEIKDQVLDERFSFSYNKFYQSQSIYKIPFAVFADLTLWVNYLGMAEHLYEEATITTGASSLAELRKVISIVNTSIEEFSLRIERIISDGENFSEEFNKDVHRTASHAVTRLSTAIIGVYPKLGIKASREDHVLNQIFRDYFTGTQHQIFASTGS